MFYYGIGYYARPRALTALRRCRRARQQAPSMALSAPVLILKKRNGEELSEDEVLWFVNAYATGELPDYQCVPAAGPFAR